MQEHFMPAGSNRSNKTGGGWDLDPEARARVEAAIAIIRAERKLAKMTTELLSGLDLTGSRYEILFTLHFSESGTSSLGTLARGLAIHPPTLTYTIDQLADQGLITRTTSTADRRVVLAQITPAGRSLVVKANAKMASTQFGLAALSKAEAERLARSLAKVTF